MKDFLKRIIKKNVLTPEQLRLNSLIHKYRDFSMIPPDVFAMNLQLCKTIEHISGDIVECGVWRGGMIAAMAEWLGVERTYYLYDSFEGLPPVQEVDGPDAKRWQENTTDPWYFDNCRAEITFAEQAMQLALPQNPEKIKIVKGWFSDTLNSTELPENIAVLRLDSDWYESTMVCLDTLYKRVVKGGLIIIDDYYTWDGCSKAVHDYLSKNKCIDRIHQWKDNVAYLKIK